MKKNMYSLMLSKNLIEEIDNLAYKQNTNRSNLINHILAEHLSMSTPEMHIQEIFEYLSSLLKTHSNLLIQNSNSASIICIKSSLNYKYKPSIKYSIELYKYNQEYFGALKIQFRTQSETLIHTLSTFFEIWVELEAKNLKPLIGNTKIIYTIDINKFERSLITPHPLTDNKMLSESVGKYIDMFDNVLKKYIKTPDIKFSELENYYLTFLKNCNLII